MDIFNKNGYPENFLNNYFEIFPDNKHRIQERMMTMPKKLLVLVHLYLRPLSLQTRSKLRNSLKDFLTLCKLQIVFKIQNKASKAFCFKNSINKTFHLVLFFKFQCELRNESC